MQEGLCALVSGGSMQAVGCCTAGFVPDWDTTFKERDEFWEWLWSFREERCCSS